VASASPATAQPSSAYTHFTPPSPIGDVGPIAESHVPLPDDVLLAHKGRLVLDALPDFRRYVFCTRAFAAFDTTLLRQFP
jgi:hypothetical protein